MSLLFYFFIFGWQFVFEEAAPLSTSLHSFFFGVVFYFFNLFILIGG